MIRVVIGDQQQLAKVGLSVAVWNSGEQVDTAIRGDALQRPAVGAEPRERRVPRLRILWPRRLGPVIVGPFLLAVPRIPAELEDVALRDTHVLDDVPDRVRAGRRHGAAEPRRHSAYRVIEGDMSTPPVQEVGQLRAQQRV